MKNSEASNEQRISEEREGKNKNICKKHTTKKFKMSDFCFLFLSENENIFI